MNYRKTDRQSSTPSKAASALPEPLTIAEWPCNRRGEQCRVVLQSFEGHALVDVRRWFPQGDEFRPGKGCALTIGNMPALAKAINAALTKACELGLVDGDAE